MNSSKKYSRRKFIQTGSVTGLSMMVGGSYLLSSCGSKQQAGEAATEAVAEAAAEPIHKASVQLYTFRNQLSEDIPGSLDKVVDTGLKYVETYDFSEDLSFDEVGKMLRDRGLEVSSMHSEIPIGAEGEKALRRADAYQCDLVIWHGWPEDKRYQTAEGISELAGIYNEANDFMKSNGLKFGLHNHWWEMMIGEDGTYPLEHLLKEIDEDIFLEIDTYWVKTAGQDPAEIIRKYGDRVKLMHIKDGNARYHENLATEPHEPMVPLGQGVQDFPAIFEACGDDPKWWVIELDESAIDPFEAVKQSYDYLIENKMVKI